MPRKGLTSFLGCSLMGVYAVPAGPILSSSDGFVGTLDADGGGAVAAGENRAAGVVATGRGAVGTGRDAAGGGGGGAKLSSSGQASEGVLLAARDLAAGAGRPNAPAAGVGRAAAGGTGRAELTIGLEVAGAGAGAALRSALMSTLPTGL